MKFMKGVNMIKSKSELQEYLEVEQRGGGHTDLVPFLYNEQQIIRRILKVLRYTEYYSNTNNILKYVYNFRLQFLQNKFGLHIPPNCCGKGLSIPHLGPIIINSNVIIGENCRIHVGVNIGAHNGKTPIIGNNVYIGPGAKIFGDIIISDNVQIGANAVVNKSIKESNVVVVGVPAEIRKRK